MKNGMQTLRKMRIYTKCFINLLSLPQINEMRLIACILSVYILLLSVLPCPDVPEDHVTHTIELTQQAADSHADHTDHCSPFCTCSCCSVPVIYASYGFQFNDFSLLEEHCTVFKPSYISIIQTSIWQPPKMS